MNNITVRIGGGQILNSIYSDAMIKSLDKFWNIIKTNLWTKTSETTRGF